MTLKNISVSLLFIIFITSIGRGQSTLLTGKVQDEAGKPIKFVTVNLLRATDTVLYEVSICDTAGSFLFTVKTSGKYFLRLTALGYMKLQTPVFEISGNKSSTVLDALTMLADTKSLQSVTISAMRPTIIQKADRLIVAIEGTVLAAGRTAFEVLSTAPGVSISPEGSINLNGRSGVSVMIDGKLTYLSATDLRNLLESMPAENVKNIEVITNPPATYDAEGTAGILNINLKKNKHSGLIGSIYLAYLYDFHRPTYTGGGNLNYKNGKWNSFINLDVSKRSGGRNGTFTRIFTNGSGNTYFDQAAEGNFTSIRPHNVLLGSDYSASTKTTIGYFFNYSLTRVSSDFFTDTYIGRLPDEIDQYIDADNYSHSQVVNLTGNLHLVHKLDTLGRTFSADFFYVNIVNKGNADFYNYFTDIPTGAKKQEFLNTNTPGGYDIYAVKADYTLPINKKQQMDAGIKASKVISDNDSRFYINNGQVSIPDPQRTNHFNFRENIFAVYINYTSKLNQTFAIQAGMRTEYTENTGTSFTTGLITNHSYLQLFPSLFLNQVISKNYTVSYSFSRRISRPGYGNLNPFRFYRDPYTWEEGNPYLKPQYSNSFNITQLLKKSYSMTMSYEIVRDVITELPKLDADNATTAYTTGNVKHGKNLSFTVGVPVQINRKWLIQNSLIATYNRLQIDVDGLLQDNNRFNIYAGSYQTIQLPNDFVVELNTWYKGPTAQGLYTIAAMWRMDIGLKRTFLEKKLQVNIGCNDLFKTQRYVYTTRINGNVNDFNQYFRVRNVGVSLRYSFSSGQKFNGKRRTTAIEEVDRT